MCGRYESAVDTEKLEEIFKDHIGDLDIAYDIDEVLKTENIAPTDRIRVVLLDKDKFKLKTMKWAIRSKVFDPRKKGQFDPYIEKDIFNTRIETIKKSPQWKSLILNNRCIVPMTAFYEWIPKNGKKEPRRISISEEMLFFAGGIYMPSDLRSQTGASIITCEPNTFMIPIHNRMPVLFRIDEAKDYLVSPGEAAISMCVPFDNSIRMNQEKAGI